MNDDELRLDEACSDSASSDEEREPEPRRPRRRRRPPGRFIYDDAADQYERWLDRCFEG